MTRKKHILKSKLSEASIFKPTAVALAVALCCSHAWAFDTTYVLTGDYIKVGVTNAGTLGDRSNESSSNGVGILYDNNGRGEFTSGYDYLTPGIPFEGFTVNAEVDGTLYSATNNNMSSKGDDFTTTNFENTSTVGEQSATWTGTYSDGDSVVFTVQNDVSFLKGDKKLTISTTISSSEALTEIQFARFTDPDARADPDDSSATLNYRGDGDVAATNLVYAEALASKYVIGLYSEDASNTGIDDGWTGTPDVSKYFDGEAGSNVEGDYAIGIGFETPTLNADGSVTYTYYYIFGADIAAAIADNVSGILASLESEGNMAAMPAAAIMEKTPELAVIFQGLETHKEISDAATQTLPLLSGASSSVAKTALAGVSKIVQTRMATNQHAGSVKTGKSSGESFSADEHVWMKAFSSWAEQDMRDGIAGYTADTNGLILGVDGEIDNMQLGFAFAYAKSDVVGKSTVAQQSNDVDIYQLITYGSYPIDQRTEVDFQFGVGLNVNKGLRELPAATTVARSDYDSHAAYVGLGLNREYSLSPKTQFTPSLRADYVWMKDKAYTETGAGVYNLVVDERTVDALVLSVQGEMTHQFDSKTSFLARGGVGYDVLGEAAAITSAYAGAPSSGFVTYGAEPSRWIANLGLGLMYKTKSGVEMTGSYDLEYREDFLNQGVSFKIRCPW